MNGHRTPRTARRRVAGFTLLEVMVSLLIVILVLFAVLSLFDLNSRVARSQTQISEMQQALRIGQYTLLRDTRMAGRGGLPRGPMPGGFAVAVNNEAADGDTIDADDAGSPRVLAETDVLTIRGVFSSPIYQVDPTGSLILDDPVNPTSGSVTIENPNTTTGVPQDLEPLLQVLDDDLPDALILVSPVDDAIYAVVQITPGACPGRACLVDDGITQTVTVDFTVSGGTHTAAYLALSDAGAFPAGLTSAAHVGILEEHRFYIREEFSIPGDDTSDPAPRLSRARFYPNTQEPYGGDPVNLRNDVADNIMDLQVALAMDTDGDGAVLDDGTSADEWLYNAPDDDDTDAKWNPGIGNRPSLFYVRISALARTDRRQTGFIAPAIAGIEDRDYTETDPPGSDGERQGRMYHRRLLETVVDLRNVS